MDTDHRRYFLWQSMEGWHACCKPVICHHQHIEARQTRRRATEKDEQKIIYIQLSHLFQGAVQIFRLQFFEKFNEFLFRCAE